MSSQRLFNVSKVGVFCDAITHSMEKRKGGNEVKVVTLTLRAQPFDAKLATAIDDGLNPEGSLRSLLFRQNHPGPKPVLRRCDVALGCPRQNLSCYASPDTETASILLDHAKITGTYARTEKGVAGLAFVFKASFGPADKTQLEYTQDWLNTQRFVTFEEAEPSLEFEEAGPGDVDDEDITEADEKARKPVQPPMWTDGDEKNPSAAANDAPAKAKGEKARMLPHRHKDRKSAARAKQGGKKRR